VLVKRNSARHPCRIAITRFTLPSAAGPGHCRALPLPPQEHCQMHTPPTRPRGPWAVADKGTVVWISPRRSFELEWVRARNFVSRLLIITRTLCSCRIAVGVWRFWGRHQLHSAPGGFELAAIVSLSFATGAPRIFSHGYDPSFQLPWSRPCSNWTAAGMLSVYVPTQNGSHRVVGESFRQAGRLRHLLLRGSNSICMRESGFPQPPRTTLLESATRFALEWPDGNLQAASHGTRSAHARQSAARRTLRAPASTRKAPQMPGECCIRKDKAVRVLCSVFIRASLQFSKSGFRFEADRRIIE